MLMVGLFTRPVAFLLSGEMVFAIFEPPASTFLGSFGVAEPGSRHSYSSRFLLLGKPAPCAAVSRRRVAASGATNERRRTKCSRLATDKGKLGATCSVQHLYLRRHVRKDITDEYSVSAASLIAVLRPFHRRVVRRASWCALVRDASGGVPPGVTVEAIGAHRKGPQRRRTPRD